MRITMSFIAIMLTVVMAKPSLANERLNVLGIYPGMSVEEMKALPPLNPQGNLLCTHDPESNGIPLMDHARRSRGNNPDISWCTIIEKNRNDGVRLAITTELHITRADVHIYLIQVTGQRVIATASFVFPSHDHDAIVHAYTAKYGPPSGRRENEVYWDGPHGDLLSIKRMPSGRSHVLILGIVPFLQMRQSQETFVPPRL